MSDKPRKPGLEESEAQYKPEHDDTVEFTDTYLDAWFERNKEALEQSFRKADEEFARGEYYTLDEVMAELEERAKRRQSHKG